MHLGIVPGLVRSLEVLEHVPTELLELFVKVVRRDNVDDEAYLLLDVLGPLRLLNDRLTFIEKFLPELFGLFVKLLPLKVLLLGHRRIDLALTSSLLEAIFAASLLVLVVIASPAAAVLFVGLAVVSGLLSSVPGKVLFHLRSK
jgi:hypothetical protein